MRATNAGAVWSALAIAIAFCLESNAFSREPEDKPDQPSTEIQEHIRRSVNGFAPFTLDSKEPPVALNLEQLMQICNLPGLSIAVVDNYKIAWTKCYGVTEMGGKTGVTPQTLFQAGSVSKPIAALAALSLVEQGKLSLDEDVNVKLRFWKLPENAFTKEQKVTLRRILTHTAGTTGGYAPGYESGKPLPTLVQILNGQAPSQTGPIVVDFVPGSQQRYSGGGMTVMQQLMMDVTGAPFPQIVKETVFDKLGLQNSTFEQPLPASRALSAASGHQLNGETHAGKWKTIPQMAAAGLWTTPSDLARIGIEIALSKQGKSNCVLSETMTREMLSVQTDPAANKPGIFRSMRMGLSWNLDEKDPSQFQYNGDDPGFLTQFVMWDSGRGIFLMANTESRCVSWLLVHLMNNIAKEYGWRYQATTVAWPNSEIELLATAKLRGAEAALRKFRELKERKANGGPPVFWASTKDSSSPSEFDLWFLASGLADSAHLPDAIRLMKTCTAEYPTWWIAYYSLGDFYIRQKDHEAASGVADLLADKFPNEATAQYSAACIRTRCARLAAKDDPLAEAQRLDLARHYADQAMTALQSARKAGFHDAAKLKTDSDLEYLRARPDFQSLIAELDKSGK